MSAQGVAFDAARGRRRLDVADVPRGAVVVLLDGQLVRLGDDGIPDLVPPPGHPRPGPRRGCLGADRSRCVMASNAQRPEDRLRELAEAARARLRHAAARGDHRAAQALRDLGEEPPAPPVARHWSETEPDSSEGC